MRGSNRILFVAAAALSGVMMLFPAAARAPLLDEQRRVLTMAPVLEKSDTCGRHCRRGDPPARRGQCPAA
jgi:hypothetical protein